MPSSCPFLAVPWVGLQIAIMAFLGHTLSFLETIIILMTTALFYIRLNYKSALA